MKANSRGPSKSLKELPISELARIDREIDEKVTTLVKGKNLAAASKIGELVIRRSEISQSKTFERLELLLAAVR